VDEPLPADMIVAMFPLLRRLSIEVLIPALPDAASQLGGEKCPPPPLKFTDATCTPAKLFRTEKTKSRERMKSEKKNSTHGRTPGQSVASLNSEYILMAMSLADFATPFVGCPERGCELRPTEIPATWVPCSHPSKATLQAAADPGVVDDDTPPGHSDTEPFNIPRVPCVVEKQASWIV